MVFINLKSISNEYANSGYYRLMTLSDDNDDFYVPDEYYVEILQVKDSEEFKKVIEVVMFWNFDIVPECVNNFIYKNFRSLKYFSRINKHSSIREMIIKILNNDRFIIKNFKIFIMVFELL